MTPTKEGAEFAVGRRIGADDHFMPGATFGFRPGLGAAGDVGRVGALRDDAFERQAAGRAQDRLAAGLEMFDEAKAVILAGVGEKLLQPRLSLAQRQGAKILATFEQQIEGEIDECVGLAFGQSGLKRGEVRGAVFIQGTNFSVDDGVRQIAGGSRDGRIFGGPVEPLARLQGCLASSHAHLDAVAVELDLVQPSVSRRRTRKGLAKLGSDEVGEISGRDAVRLLLSPRLCLALFGGEAGAAVPDSICLYLAALQHERLRLATLAGSDGLHGAAGSD